jgi:uncharacterized membrane protein required for colicin V production
VKISSDFIPIDLPLSFTEFFNDYFMLGRILSILFVFFTLRLVLIYFLLFIPLVLAFFVTPDFKEHVALPDQFLLSQDIPFETIDLYPLLNSNSRKSQKILAQLKKPSYI